MKKIALIADFNPGSETHAATVRSIQHSADRLGLSCGATWVGTDDISSTVFREFHGFWIGTGSPYKNIRNVLALIEHARRNDYPTFGTCGGFQHIILEIARNELAFPDAAHAEYEPSAPQPFIVPLPCSLRGREMRIRLEAGSTAAQLYGDTEVVEKYYCSFGVSPDFVPAIRESSLRVVGSDSEGEMRVVEIPTHRFFLGTLFVPQVRSTPAEPHPLVDGFLRAVNA